MTDKLKDRGIFLSHTQIQMLDSPECTLFPRRSGKTFVAYIKIAEQALIEKNKWISEISMDYFDCGNKNFTHWAKDFVRFLNDYYPEVTYRFSNRSLLVLKVAERNVIDISNIEYKEID